MAIAILPVVFAIVGALLYVLATRAELKELGRLTFASGMLALAFALAAHVVRIG